MAATPEHSQAAVTTRKQVAIQVVYFAVGYTVFNLLLPELPPLWGAILFAVLFALVAVALPLVVARRRSPLPTIEASS